MENPQDVSRVTLRLVASYEETNLGNPADPLDDLIYIILSGQTNEALYQASFKELKAAYPRWDDVLNAPTEDIAKLIERSGLSKQKASYIKGIIAKLKQDFGTANLETICNKSNQEAEEYLASLPGSGIKTARCVLMYSLHRQVLPADVNCLRIMERLGWLEWGKRRAELFANQAQNLVPPVLRRPLHIGMVQHGREVCTPTNPQCGKCCLRDLCPVALATAPKRPVVVDLCCGAGGFSWGFLQAGYDVRLGVDLDPHALATFTQNIPGAGVLQADLTNKKTLSNIQGKLKEIQPNVVIAGPPCQGFSRAGPRDTTDPRNAVFRSAIKLAVQLKPDVIVFENVMGLGGNLFINHLRKAMGVVRRAGYKFDHVVLHAGAFGVAQTRKRILLVATRAHRRELLVVLQGLADRPEVADLTVAKALAGLPADTTANGHIANHLPMPHSARVIAKIKRIEPGTGPMSYRKLHPDRPAPTLICGHRALPCHFSIPRTLTPREAARIQSFPDFFEFFGPKGNQMNQVANAVPPKLSVGVALAVAQLAGHQLPGHCKSLLEQILRQTHFRPNPIPGLAMPQV